MFPSLPKALGGQYVDLSQVSFIYIWSENPSPKSEAKHGACIGSSF